MNKKIELSGGETPVTIEVKKLVVADFGLVLKKLNKLPSKFGDLDSLTTDAILAVLPARMADSMDELADIICTATDASKEIVLNLDIADFTELILTILEVNQFEKIASFLGRIAAMRKASQSKTPSNLPPSKKS